MICKTVAPALGNLRPENNLGNLRRRKRQKGKMEEDNGKEEWRVKEEKGEIIKKKGEQ